MHQPNYLRGMVFYLMASMLFSSVNAIVKVLAKIYPLPEVLLARALVPLMLFCVHAGLQGRLKRIVPKSSLRVFWVSFTFMLSLGTMFYGFTAMPFAEMTIYMFTAPFFTVTLMRFLEGEPITKSRVLVLMLGFSGVVVASSTNGIVFDTLMFVGLAAGLMSSVSNITMGRASKRENIESIIFWFHVLGFFILLFFLPGTLKPIDFDHVWMFLTLGALSYGGGLCLVQSMRMAPITFLAPFSYLSFVVASIYGVFIFNEPLTTQLIMGAVIITLSGILNHKMGRSKV